jgi:hypothetical protein
MSDVQVVGQAGGDMLALTGRVERLVGAFTGAMMATAEAAAERIELAAEVARVTQRMAAFGAVLEAVGAQKEALLERLGKSKGPTRALIEQQLLMLTAQEVAVLKKAGIDDGQATAAVAVADGGGRALYVRDGRKFVPLEGGPAAPEEAAA